MRSRCCVLNVITPSEGVDPPACAKRRRISSTIASASAELVRKKRLDCPLGTERMNCPLTRRRLIPKPVCPGSLSAATGLGKEESLPW